MTTPLPAESIEALDSIAKRCAGCQKLLSQHEWKVTDQKPFTERRQELLSYGQLIHGEATKLSLVLRGDSSAEGVKSIVSRINDILFRATMTAASFASTVCSPYRKRIQESTKQILEKFSELAMGYTVKQNRYQVALTLTSVAWNACDELKFLPRSQVESLAVIAESSGNIIQDAIQEVASSLRPKSIEDKLDAIGIEDKVGGDEEDQDLEDFDFYDDLGEMSEEENAVVQRALEMMTHIVVLLRALVKEIRTIPYHENEDGWTGLLDQFVKQVNALESTGIDIGAAIAMDRSEVPTLVDTLVGQSDALFRAIMAVPVLSTPTIIAAVESAKHGIASLLSEPHKEDDV